MSTLGSYDFQALTNPLIEFGYPTLCCSTLPEQATSLSAAPVGVLNQAGSMNRKETAPGKLDGRIGGVCCFIERIGVTTVLRTKGIQPGSRYWIVLLLYGNIKP